MTKQLKESVHHKKRFLTELVQNGLNHSKLAAKQPKRPNCTKTENRSKTLKAKKNKKLFGNDFLDEISKHIFSDEKQTFLTKPL